MAEPEYEIDDAGDLVEAGPARGGDDETTPVTPEQARSTIRAIVLAEAIGVLLLLAGAAYYADLRGVLLIAAAVYALLAVGMTAILRRSIYERVEENPPASPVASWEEGGSRVPPRGRAGVRTRGRP